MNKFIWFAMSHSRIALIFLFILIAGACAHMLLELWVINAIQDALPQLEQDLIYIRPLRMWT